MWVNIVKYAIGAYFTGFEKTDWSGSGRSLRLCSELEKRDERPNPPLSASDTNSNFCICRQAGQEFGFWCELHNMV